MSMHFASESGRRFARILALVAAIVLVLGDSAVAVTSSVSPAFAEPANAGATDQPAFRFPWDAQQTWKFASAPSSSELDFTPDGSAQVLAAAGGDVYYSGGQTNDLTVKIRHGATPWETWYVHLDTSLYGKDGFLVGPDGAPEPIAVNQGQYLGDAVKSMGIQLIRNSAPETWSGKVINGWLSQGGSLVDTTTGATGGFVSTNVQPPIGLLPRPVRFLDTRLEKLPDPLRPNPYFGPISNESTRCIQVTGQMGIPANATGVIANVTAVNHSKEGWLTLFPLGQPVPATSTVNFDLDQYAVANGALARVGLDGKVCVYFGTVNSVAGRTDAVLDVTGYLSNSAPARLPLLQSPLRLADTRTVGGPISSGSSRCFLVTGKPGLPAGVPGVMLNVTAVGHAKGGWLTVYPSGQPVPATSTLNFDPAEYAIANGVLARTGPDGKVCVSVGTVNAVPDKVHVLLDATGYLADMTNQVQLLSRPLRGVDTRFDGGPIDTGQSRCWKVDKLPGFSGIPSDAHGLMLNGAVSDYTVNGWLTLYPFGQVVPKVSWLNFDLREYAIANNTIARVGDDDKVCVNVGSDPTTPGRSDVILDAQGYLAPQTAGRLPSLPMLASDSAGNNWQIDLTCTDVTGATCDTNTGKFPGNGVAATDIARSEYGRLYGESSTTLYQVDPISGVVATVGNFHTLNAPLVGVNAMTFSPAGDLFGATAAGFLYRIDPNTGSAKLIGSLVSPSIPDGSSGDLVFTGDGTLLAILNRAAGGNDVLVRVNAATGVASRINPNPLLPPNDLGFVDVFGLAFSGDTLYGLTGYPVPQKSCGLGALVRIDQKTGSATFERCLRFAAFGASS
jgi:hypothetical protein